MSRADKLISMQNSENKAISIIPISWAHDLLYSDYLLICEEIGVEPVSQDEYSNHLKCLDDYFTDSNHCQISSEVLREEFY